MTIVNHRTPVTTVPHPNGVRVTVRFSSSAGTYHLIEVIQKSQSVCIQISNECPPEMVAALAAKIRGLGA